VSSSKWLEADLWLNVVAAIDQIGTTIDDSRGEADSEIELEQLEFAEQLGLEPKKRSKKGGSEMQGVCRAANC
jgi:hypothetical protein